MFSKETKIRLRQKSGYIALLLALALLLPLVLSACGEGTATSSPATSNATTNATTSSVIPTSTPVVINNPPTSGATNATGTTTAAVPATTTAGTTAASNQGGAVPRFEAGKCDFKLSGDQSEGKTVRCGTLVVAEEHAKAGNGKTIRLPVAIFKSVSSTPAPEPIVFLQGGPGGSAQSYVSLMTGTFYRTLAAGNDVIVLEQRGTGKSQPSLSCPDQGEQGRQDLSEALTPQEDVQRGLNEAIQCRDKLVQAGVNLNAYNSAENAADINDLRLTLGYQKLNLHGTSYGTRLALEVMRNYSPFLRSVVIDSVVPPQTNLYEDEINSFNRSLNLIFSTCAADADCNKTYPNLKGVFSDVVKQLNDKPATVTARHPVSGKSYTVKVTGNRMVDALHVILYSTEYLPFIPALLFSLQKGDYSALTTIFSIVISNSDDVAIGMYYSVNCAEEAPFNNRGTAAATLVNVLPEVRDAEGPSLLSEFNVCDRWGVNKADAGQNQAVSSAVPTLVVTGQFDPITPPPYAQAAARTLSKSYYVEVPDGGHGPSITTRECELTMLQKFFANPEQQPDTSCVAKQVIKFRPFPTLAVGKSGDVPDYANATQVSLAGGLEKSLSSETAGSYAATSYYAFVTGDAGDKVQDFYSQALAGKGYYKNAEQSQNLSQGSLKIQSQVFMKDIDTAIAVQTYGPLDASTLPLLAAQAPDLSQKAKPGDTLVLVISTGRD